MYWEQTPHSHSKIAAFCSCGGVKNTIPSPASTVLRTELELWLRALPICILTIGKKRSKGIQLIDEEYREKLKYYCSVDDVQIKSNPKNTSDVKAQIEGEDNIITQHIRSEDWVVVLDERGLDIGSEQMAELVGDAGKTHKNCKEGS
ncbi:hypothetical protein AAC387_Pa07g0359 [Persea americana]